MTDVKQTGAERLEQVRETAADGVTCFVCGREMPHGELFTFTEWEEPHRDSGSTLLAWCSERCAEESLALLTPADNTPDADEQP